MTQATKRRTASEWAKVVDRWRTSGSGLEEFASSEGVRPATLAWWSSELKRRSAKPKTEAAEARRRRGSTPAFTELRVVAGRADATPGSIEIHGRSGLVVRVHGGVDPALLVNVLRAVSQC